MPLRRMPALGSLRAFEAAARRLSFKDAACELSVTPGAVSQQIKSLEEDLGIPLFVRATRSVALTEAGRALQPELTAGFLQIRQAVDKVRPGQSKNLRINSSNPIISKWVLPRLHRFTALVPDLQVNIETESGLNEMRDDGPDVVIRFTKTLSNDLYFREIHEELLLPVASPDLINRLKIEKPSDLVRAPLLHDTSFVAFGDDNSWDKWFSLTGLPKAGHRRGVSFERHAADQAIDAAIGGAGFALGRSLLVHDALKDGRLICPFGPILSVGIKYYVCCRHGSEREPNIARFMDWAQEEAALLSTLKAMQLESV